jgi:hypothetical protein
VAARGSKVTAKAGGKLVSARLEKSGEQAMVLFSQVIELHEGDELELVISG